MVDDVVIRAEGLGKRYIIGHQARERVPTFRDAIVRNVKEFARTSGDILKGKPLISGNEIEEFWALKDVSFEIRRGDVVGVIGRNGAGKSTLLKVLSRITEPSAGRVEIKGRVASLLEVGTGFHPELTGRENIYLNGAILGMSREEIRRKFDEIVAFAEIEKFLDTPVKRYSSGMYVRLAFAVAAHLEPDILIVDEVLAVGDAEFQKKCLGKMQDVAGHGRTVLFVSHNTGSLSSICRLGALLGGGRLIETGPIGDVLQAYVRIANSTALDLKRQFGGPLQSLTVERVSVNHESVCETLSSDEPIRVDIEGRAHEHVRDFRFAVAVFKDGIRIMTIHDAKSDLPPGRFRVTAEMPPRTLRPGTYSVAAGGRRVSGDEWMWGTDLAFFEIVPNWRDGYEHDNIGVFNSIGSITRITEYSS